MTPPAEAQALLTVDEALRAVLLHARPLPSRPLPLADALGLTLDEDVAADLDSPPFDKALMDGYAFRSHDLAATGAETRLRVVDEITAGRNPARALGPGEAALIMTGAPLPEGADVVVMIEKTRREPDGRHVVFATPDLAPGRNVLRRGREMRAGELIARRGDRLSPARLGLLATVGRVTVSARPRPVVAVVPTGDELVEPGVGPGPGQIRNSNATLLAALANEAGAVVQSHPIAPDDREILAERLAKALAGADVVLISGGVSAGTLDLVPDTLQRLGVVKVFHKVRVKPGKPLWFGVGPAREGGRPGPLVFGLPGNPVSSLVGFTLFVRPAIDAVMEREPRGGAIREARLSRPFDHRGDRPTYHPSRRLGDEGPAGVATVEPLDWAGSADLRGVASADGFAVFPAGDRAYREGEIVGYLPLG